MRLVYLHLLFVCFRLFVGYCVAFDRCFVMLFALCVVGLRLAWVLWIRFRLRDFRVVGLD